MASPKSKFTCIANLWIRQMVFEKAGDANDGHIHNYDHTTLLSYGSVKVNVEGKTTEFKAPQVIYIQKGKSHFIEALEDNTIAYCVHALRNKDTEEILDAEQVPNGIHVDSIFTVAKPL